MDFAQEYCPYCEGVVNLTEGFVIHKCECGEDLLPCALCDKAFVGCVDCPFEKQEAQSYPPLSYERRC
ncbi:MAG TPA: hypothetical protein IAA33_05825 [Candidatus Helicobacter avicola]|nr:hypothetical protein [Candidatus Helicobacter avicola]